MHKIRDMSAAWAGAVSARAETGDQGFEGGLSPVEVIKTTCCGWVHGIGSLDAG